MLFYADASACFLGFCLSHLSCSVQDAVTKTLQSVSQLIISRGGVVRKIEHMGEDILPHRTRVHKEYFQTSWYVALSPTIVIVRARADAVEMLELPKSSRSCSRAPTTRMDRFSFRSICKLYILSCPESPCFVDKRFFAFAGHGLCVSMHRLTRLRSCRQPSGSIRMSYEQQC